MVSPSDEDRKCAMFDSFSKTASRNYYRDLLRAEKRRDKNYQEEPVEYILELLGREAGTERRECWEAGKKSMPMTDCSVWKKKNGCLMWSSRVRHRQREWLRIWGNAL